MLQPSLFQDNNKTAGKKWNMFNTNSEEARHQRRAGVFIVTFEHISHLIIVFHLLNLS